MRFLVLFVAVCAIGSAALMARAGLDGGMNPICLSAWRLTVASACLLLWQSAHPDVARPWSAEARRYVVLAGLFLGLHFATWIGSLDYISVAKSTLLVATAPLWAGLAGLFIPDLKPRPVFWAGLVLAGAGTWAVTTQGLTWRGGGQEWLGDLLASCGAVCLVPYFVFSQRVQKVHGWLPTITWMYSSAAVFLWVISFATRTASLPETLPVLGSILGMALIAQLVGHSGLNWSLRHFTAGQVAMATLMEPVFAAALAWPLLGEPVTAGQGAGGILLLAGVAIALSGREQASGS